MLSSCVTTGSSSSTWECDWVVGSQILTNPSFPATSGFLQNPHITLMKSSKQQSRRTACDPWRNRCAVENNFDGTIQNPNLILILRRGNSKALSKLSGGWFVYQCLKPAAHGSVVLVTDFDVVIWSQKLNHNIWIIWFDLTFSPWAVWVYLIWNVSHWPSTTVNNHQQLPTQQSSKVQLCWRPKFPHLVEVKWLNNYSNHRQIRDMLCTSMTTQWLAQHWPMGHTTTHVRI